MQSRFPTPTHTQTIQSNTTTPNDSISTNGTISTNETVQLPLQINETLSQLKPTTNVSYIPNTTNVKTSRKNDTQIDVKNVKYFNNTKNVTSDIIVAPNTTATNVTANVSVHKEPPQWGGCVDPRDEKNSLVKKGSKTSLCVTVSEGIDWALGINYARWFFKPIADQYSEFTVENCK